jgi:hypothetical protein
MTTPVARGEDEEDRLDLLERRVDRLLHPLGQLVERPLEAGQIREHELPVVAVRDPEDPLSCRLRLVGDDRDLAAAECVDERRLAHVRAASDSHEAGPHSGRSHVSGRRSSAAYSAIVPSARRK